MRWKRVAALVVLLVAFSVVSGFALLELGYVGLWKLAFQSWGTLQLFCDLACMVSLVLGWMVRDSKTSGVPVAPYFVLTLLAGSPGPLLYLLHREWRGQQAGS